MTPELVFIRRATLALSIAVIVATILLHILATDRFLQGSWGQPLAALALNATVLAVAYLLTEAFLWRRVLRARDHPMVNAVFRNVQSYWTEYSDNLPWDQILSRAQKVDVICRWYSGVPRTNLAAFRSFFRRGGELTLIMPSEASTKTHRYPHFSGDLLNHGVEARCAGALLALQTARQENVGPVGNVSVFTTDQIVGHAMIRVDDASIFLFLYSAIVPEPEASPVLELADVEGARAYFDSQWTALLKDATRESLADFGERPEILRAEASAPPVEHTD